MFADISGFTRWSATRTPTEVFQLLESVYSAFDRQAKRLKVFKVETIGDCYVGEQLFSLPSFLVLLLRLSILLSSALIIAFSSFSFPFILLWQSHSRCR